MGIDVSRSTNNPQLQWRRVSDLRKVSECGRYLIDRRPDYTKHPMMTYQYTAKRADQQVIAPSPFETFDLAAAACERDLSEQPQPKGK